MPFFAHDGLNFRYHEEGNGIPFLFQQGLGGDLTQPLGLFRPPPHIRLIAFDCRGHGQTRPLGDPGKIGISAFADDLVALLSHLNLSRVIVGGISMGAAVALNFALRYPGRALGLILSRPAWLDGPNPWNVEVYSLMARLIRLHGARRGLELFKQTDCYRRTLREYPAAAASLALQFENPRAEETVDKLERLINDSPNHDRQEWRSIRLPVLVLANRHDPGHPFEYGEVLAREIPGAEFQELTAKSVSSEQHSADVQRCISQFLREHFLARDHPKITS